MTTKIISLETYIIMYLPDQTSDIQDIAGHGGKRLDNLGLDFPEQWNSIEGQ